MKQRTNELPLFFNYKAEKTDNGYESIQDFFIGWTIRCSAEQFKSKNELLNLYSKRILYALIFGSTDKNGLQLQEKEFYDFEVINVVTKRQVALIDLVAEVEYKINGNSKKCILSIENKWYSGIRHYQLEKSFEFIRQIYEDEIIDIVLFCDYEKISDDVISHCTNNKYKYLTVSDLKDYSQITFETSTKNDLFDEYWLNF